MAMEDECSITPIAKPSPDSAQKTLSMLRSRPLTMGAAATAVFLLVREICRAEKSPYRRWRRRSPLSRFSTPIPMFGAYSRPYLRRRASAIRACMMLLTSAEHCIGRLVDDARFQIIAHAVSAKHCKVYRKRIAIGYSEQQSESFSLFLKDTSTNGTYLNWDKLNKNGSEAKLQHGDTISIAFVPQHEEYCAENKRLKGIGIGASGGPISLNDFRSLQRSNMELRSQLENEVSTVESLRSENLAAIVKHETGCGLSATSAVERSGGVRGGVRIASRMAWLDDAWLRNLVHGFIIYLS